MPWLESLDTALFRFINVELTNPFFDAVLPQFSKNAWFIPALLVFGAVLMYRGGLRARLMILLLALVIGGGDALVINRLKKIIHRPRPHSVLPGAILRVGRGSSESMPSSHTATWFAATLVAFIYYRRSKWVMVPLAVTMGFSRVYLGAHYPSDVLAGSILGAGYAAAGLLGLNQLWGWVGRRWFPVWFRRVPSLFRIVDAPLAVPVTTGEEAEAKAAQAAEKVERERQWLRMGYVLIAGVLGLRLAYLAWGVIELSEDEAYQWLWSKHLAFSYYSKPPMIALLQYLGTTLGGDTDLGVRFLSPVISAAASLLMLNFFSRQVNVRAALCLLLVNLAVPLLAAGSILMTIDPPLVFFWTASMLAGWKAVQAEGRARDWAWAGLWAGLAFPSKYSALFLVASFALFLVLHPAARVHLRRPGPWLGLLVLALCTVPVLIWNAQHDWVTVRHVADNGKLDQPWRPTLRYFLEFTLQEFGLLNPVFFVAILMTLMRFWDRAKQTPLLTYLFAMAAPVWFGYWGYTFHSRVHANWIAPAVVPLLALMVVYWEQRLREGERAVRVWLCAGLVVGGVAVVIFHDTDLIPKLTGFTLPADLEPLRRVRAIRDLAGVVEGARQKLGGEGRETFIIAAHYGLTGQLSFYLPEARRGLPAKPLVYVRSSRQPKNQFYFWPEYRYRESRRGQNAIYATFNDVAERPPAQLVAEFESVEDLGVREIWRGGRVFHRVQLYACRNLR